MGDLHDFFEGLVYQVEREERRGHYTQQSPVMPDVWIKYGLAPGKQQDLLMEPNWHFTTPDLRIALKERLAEDEDTGFDPARFRDTSDEGSEAIAHNHKVVVARLYFDQLIRSVLPLSSWWKEKIACIDSKESEKQVDSTDYLRWLDGSSKDGGTVSRERGWLIRIAGLIALLNTKAVRAEWDDLSSADGESGHEASAMERARIEEKQLAYLRKLFEDRAARVAALRDLLMHAPPTHSEDTFPLYTVNSNRRSSTSLKDSVAAIKADAVQNVFGISTSNVRWAVIDSGIDATHPAFRKTGADGMLEPSPFSDLEGPTRARKRGPQNHTRVRASYDFTYVRELLGTRANGQAVAKLAKMTDKSGQPLIPALEQTEMRRLLVRLLKDFEDHPVDWQKLEPFIEIKHAPDGGYRKPENIHGTHVAGIIGANWRSSQCNDSIERPPGEDVIGVCPDIEFFDLRVLDARGLGNEFAIMSAMQFVRDLNNRKDFVAVHGVNLSFSIHHDVANYACGRTPVCDEAERLVGNGTVVVAAAGNSGRARYLMPSNVVDDGFRTVSITDPGNAEKVITVGSTHRRDPHTYGVSYFSSRGPTGDGRLKPDLVAPGEKIRSTVPNAEVERLDGTSMAAPHVSGAAALILARHPEFIGQPERIKQVLCESATDLGRERYFQGAGLLDILRALQSI